MFNIVLLAPEIPANTGNIVRTCAAANCRLHLIKPLGFDTSDRELKRRALIIGTSSILVFTKIWMTFFKSVLRSVAGILRQRQRAVIRMRYIGTGIIFFLDERPGGYRKI